MEKKGLTMVVINSFDKVSIYVRMDMSASPRPTRPQRRSYRHRAEGWVKSVKVEALAVYLD